MPGSTVTTLPTSSTLSDSGERVGASLVEELLHPPGELSLGAPDEPLLGHCGVHLVRDRRRPPDRVELLVVLDGAQLFDEPAARHELEPAGAKRLVTSHGDVFRF